jgi:fumarate reductase flavoprotein subunit
MVFITTFEFSVDVLVIGGGACGAVAALSAKDAGAEVLVVERDARAAGSTAMSQGLVCAAGTAAQRAAGVDDDGEIFFADIMAKTRGQTDPVIARAIATQSGPTMDWLITHQRLPWRLDPGFRASYGNSRQRVHGWEGHGGADMVALLHQRLAEAGVDVLTQARLVDIHLHHDGRISGVDVERPDGSREQIGCGALILACGGFAANTDMVRTYMPEAAMARHNGHDGNRGDGILLGAKLGAALGDMGSYQGYGMLCDPQGISAPPGVLVEGGILINTAGARFVDESADIGGVVHPVLAQPGGHCWVVFDATIETRCAYIPEMQTLISLNAPRIGETIAALASRISVPEAALTEALAQAHQAARAGLPDLLGRRWGDDRPPQGPYRALKVVGALYHTQGGLQIDGDARVLRADGSGFANLYAGGGAARGVSGPSYWGYLPAMGLCAAVTLGRVAGLSAAQQIVRDKVAVA